MDDKVLMRVNVVKNELITQQEFLRDAKQRLLDKQSNGKITWDNMAEMVGIAPRAMKTYRMPETSNDYRPMPPVAWEAIRLLLKKKRA